MDDELQRTLGKILATQEHIIKYLDVHAKQLQEHIKDDKNLERRLDQIEHKFSYISGIGLTIVAVLSVLSDKILHLFGMK